MLARIAIVGVGLIGGSLAMALRAAGFSGDVVGVERDEESARRTVARGAVDRCFTDLAPAVASADLVVLATSVPQIRQHLQLLPDLIAAGTVVTDVGSVKRGVVWVGEAALRGAFLGGHPMAGGERSGVQAARPDLFRDAVWALTPTKSTSQETMRRVVAMTEAVGARPLILSPERHDRAVAVTSHLPHLLAYTFAALAADRAREEESLYDLAAGSFASVTRVAASDPTLWRDIALENRDALMDALQVFRNELDALILSLDGPNADAVLAHFVRGHSSAESRIPR